jgi:hypothetical protein
MTGAAIVRRMRQCGAVRAVARNAGFARIVQFRVNLRESCRAGRIIAVAKDTMAAFPGYAGVKLIRGFDVLGGGPVTDFAGEAFVIGSLLGLIDVVVTFRAGGDTGVFDGFGGNLSDGISAVMTVLPEGFRN